MSCSRRYSGVLCALFRHLMPVTFALLSTPRRYSGEPVLSIASKLHLDIFTEKSPFSCIYHFFVVPLRRKGCITSSLADVKQQGHKKGVYWRCLRLDRIFATFYRIKSRQQDECPVGMLYMPRPAIGGVGLAYRAWNSVVFLLYSGIAKPSRCVKNRRTSRFLCVS